MKRLCVFCGSTTGKTEKYMKLASQVGEMIALHRHELVYGGGRVGLMGAVANSVMKSGGHVIGVIPKNLMSKEVAHEDVSQLYVVDSMHERKKMMYDLSDAFLVIPGGMGTLDEMFEILTWAQLSLHHKPVYILNEFGFYDDLLAYLKKSSEEGFIKPEHLKLLTILESTEQIPSIL
jgi:uncharacterized protein (TIGR00730 family)